MALGSQRSGFSDQTMNSRQVSGALPSVRMCRVIVAKSGSPWTSFYPRLMIHLICSVAYTSSSHSSTSKGGLKWRFAE